MASKYVVIGRQAGERTWRAVKGFDAALDAAQYASAKQDYRFNRDTTYVYVDAAEWARIQDEQSKGTLA